MYNDIVTFVICKQVLRDREVKMKLTGKLLENKAGKPDEKKGEIIIELEDEDLDRINGGMQTHRTSRTTLQDGSRLSGMPCPVCNGFIPISMYQLLSGNSIFCPNCGLRLDLQKSSYEKSREALKKLEEAEKSLRLGNTFNC